MSIVDSNAATSYHTVRGLVQALGVKADVWYGLVARGLVASRTMPAGGREVLTIRLDVAREALKKHAAVVRELLAKSKGKGFASRG